MYRKAPNNARAALALGREYWAEGNYAEGEKFIFRATELNPHDVNASTNLAVIYADSGRCEEAVPIVQKLVTRSRPRPAHYRAMGQCAEQWEQFDKALGYHKKSLELMPGIPETRLFIARIYQKLGMPDMARHYILEELKFYPGDEAALRFLDILDEKRREAK
jgi:tetratricopeptide (TPR) repeat protein